VAPGVGWAPMSVGRANDLGSFFRHGRKALV
jgi:hypothetical protein